MSALTYRELLEQLKAVSLADIDQHVTVHVDDDEFFQVTHLGVCSDGDAADGILDEGHIYLSIVHGGAVDIRD